MQIRRLRFDGCYGIVGQVINVPVDVNTMVKSLPRSLDDDQAFNVHLKKNIVNRSSHLSGFVKKSSVQAWLRFPVEQPLYKHYGSAIDWSVFRNRHPDDNEPGVAPIDIESSSASEAPESELTQALQHTLLFNGAQSLHIAPGQHNSPGSLLFDKYAEELSFPSIYYGVAREIKSTISNCVRSSAYSMATPHHVLYMVMRNCRFRARDAFRLTVSKHTHILSCEVLHTYRHLLRNVKCVIIDEISMCSSHVLHAVNSRLRRASTKLVSEAWISSHAAISSNFHRSMLLPYTVQRNVRWEENPSFGNPWTITP